MPFPVLGSNSAVAGYEIDNSLRLTDNAYLNITRSSQSNTTGTFSAWIKTAAQNNFQLAGGHTDVNNRSYIYFPTSSGTGGLFSRTSGSLDLNFDTNAVYRDPSAWFHLVVAFDTTQSTESNRVKWYVNGEQITSFSASTYPSQNASIPILNKAAQTIGAGFGASAVSGWSDGYMAEVYYIDGTQYAASDFGETNDNGVWIPKDASGDLTFGTNGFYLEFKQTGTSQNSSGIGADTSGNDNHLAVNSLSATDVTTDTPTNNFCTMSSIDTNGQASLSEGNTQLQRGSNYAGCNGTFGVANGKWYWEIKTPSPTTSGENSSFGVSKIPHSTIGNNYLGINTNSWSIVIDNASSDIYKNHNNNFIDTNINASSNDIFQIALNMDDNKIFFGRNGTYFESGNPATNFNSAYDSVSGDPFLLPAFSMNGNDTLQANFGNAPFSISSGNADANGYGNFEYAVPSGYYALCTKNLAEYG